jgi:aspartate racemase
MNHPTSSTQIVGILGGMGPAAGADFVRLFVRACEAQLRQSGAPICDQAFPEHWLAQVPVPDRSSALDDADLGGHQPLEPMLQTLGKLAALGATTVALACNTAHAWHGTLQARFPQLEVLHVAREVARDLARRGVREAGLMATAGTYRAGLYEQAFEREGLRCHLPSAPEREQLMRGIYAGVKAGDLPLAQNCFAEVAKVMARRFDLSVMIMGCTEIPLALRAIQGMDALELVDPAALLARVLARRAYGLPAEGAEPAKAPDDE